MSNWKRLGLLWFGLTGAAVGVFTVLHQVVALATAEESASIAESALLVLEGLFTSSTPVTGVSTNAMGYLLFAMNLVGAVLGFLLHAFLVILLWEFMRERGILEE
ncbi:hypothetical protein [Halomicrobium salinisoli]|uniref:hypothetical protein n=1 Tax=Halomicrobium salinisoli TaxID=2878391 RepID=UPI001CF0A0C3|nr:hypothetical protein [Halomicrobium salinisoli]